VKGANNAKVQILQIAHSRMKSQNRKRRMLSDYAFLSMISEGQKRKGKPYTKHQHLYIPAQWRMIRRSVPSPADIDLITCPEVTQSCASELNKPSVVLNDISFGLQMPP
jgi:hypothetical protein